MNKEKFIKKYQPVINKIANGRIELIREKMKEKKYLKCDDVENSKSQAIKNIEEWRDHSLTNLITNLIDMGNTVQNGTVFTALISRKNYMKDLVSVIENEIGEACSVKAEVSTGSFELAYDIHPKYADSIHEKSTCYILSMERSH